MTRTSIVLVSIFATAACKGDTVVKDSPQTLAALDSCKKSLDDKDKLVAAEEAENARLRSGSNTGSAEIVVSIEGNVLTVKPPAGGGKPPVDTQAVSAASQQFVDVVQKSRGAIQKCYEIALKKRSDLGAHTITLTVSATFVQSGAYHDASFSPSLGDAFDSCMKTVASKWTLPTNSPAMTFRAPVSLTPS